MHMRHERLRAVPAVALIPTEIGGDRPVKDQHIRSNDAQ